MAHYPRPPGNRSVHAMTRERRAELSKLEGHHVNVALVDGSRIDDCQLVLAGKAKLWVFVNGQDNFVHVDTITDVWEAA
jgi:hypothetical protein